MSYLNNTAVAWRGKIGYEPLTMSIDSLQIKINNQINCKKLVCNACKIEYFCGILLISLFHVCHPT